MAYKVYPTALGCTQAAEALGRAYCASKGKSWPEAPDLYSPGRQPQPLAAWFQPYWEAPLPVDVANALPIRMNVDATAQAFSGQQVTITGGTIVTLDFMTLVGSAAVGQQSASVNSGP